MICSNEILSVRSINSSTNKSLQETGLCSHAQPITLHFWPPPFKVILGTSDFDKNFIVSMCGIKFWMGNGNLRSVHKNRFSKY